MVNKTKRGWIRITESVLAILILASVLLVMYDGNAVTRDADYFEDIGFSFLNDFSDDLTLGSLVLDEDITGLENYIDPHGYYDYGFAVQVCNLTTVAVGYGRELSCTDVSLPSNKEIFLEEKIISPKPGETFIAKLVRIYLWDL